MTAGELGLLLLWGDLYEGTGDPRMADPPSGAHCSVLCPALYVVSLCILDLKTSVGLVLDEEEPMLCCKHELPRC